jgi:DNA mismatch endonuclease (patch repair protein)
MRAIRRRDSGAERALRSKLHAMGLRFRVDYPIPIHGRKPRADIVFTRRRLAVFVDGCFWHGCPIHGGRPKRNSIYWDAKIARNRERDAEQSARLAASGWTVVRVWEHEDPTIAAQHISHVLTNART